MNIDSIQILRLLLYFIIYSFFGWVLESIFKSILQRKLVNSGFLYGPLCPIYGFGAIIMLLFLNTFKDNIILLFIAGFFVLSVWEYIVGVILEKKFNTKYWDYSENFLNIKGRVCLMNSVFWGILGVLFTIYIHPFIERYILFLNQEALIYIDIILGMAIITDCIITTVKLNSLNTTIEKIKDIGDTIKEKLKELKNTKEDAIEKIKDIETMIEDLKLKQEILKLKIYKRAKRLKKAFPTMKSENITMLLSQKLDFKALKEKIKGKVNKRNKEI